jgi:hypothetical protein
MFEPVEEGEQLAFTVDSINAMIEVRCAAALEEIRRMTAEAQEFINRSCGQRIRYTRERIARETEQFWQQRNATVEGQWPRS